MYIKSSRKTEDLNCKEIKKFQENLCIKFPPDEVLLYNFVILFIVVVVKASTRTKYKW